MNLAPNRTSTVWQVIDSADPALGGTTRVAVEIAAGLADLGVRSALIAKSGLKQLRADAEMSTRLYDAGVKIYPDIDSEPISRFLGAQLKSGDIVHIHGIWEPCLWRSAASSRKQGVPYIVFPHGMLDHWSLRRSFLKKRIALAAGARSMLSNASAIQCLTERDLTDTASLGLPASLVRISNGVQFLPSVRGRDEFYDLFPAVAREKRLLLFLARIHPKKGLSLLIEALQSRRLIDSNWVLVIAGAVEDSSYEAKCREAARGISDRVVWAGHLSGPKKVALLSAADLFILPSFQEGFSIAILEALAAGTPVIISKQCSFPDVAAVDAGLIVDTAPDEIARAISDMLARSPAELRAAGLRGRQLIEQQYTWNRILGQLLQTYRQLGAWV